jgi:hypothetical protein
MAQHTRHLVRRPREERCLQAGKMLADYVYVFCSYSWEIHKVPSSQCLCKGRNYLRYLYPLGRKLFELFCQVVTLVPENTSFALLLDSVQLQMGVLVPI